MVENRQGGITIIGIGSPVEGDGAGMQAVEILQRRALSAAEAVPVRWLTRERPGVALLSDWQGAERVVLIDALAPGQDTAAVVPISPADLLGQAQGISSHDIGVAETLALAAQLGQMPPQLLIYGIAPEAAGGDGSWLDALAAMLRRDLAGMLDFC
jgi:hydrogenase maturation protease